MPSWLRQTASMPAWRGCSSRGCEERSRAMQKKGNRGQASRFEEMTGGCFRGALFRRRRLQALDFRGKKRDPLVEFRNREQRKVLPDLVADFLSRSIVVLDGHAPCSMIDKDIWTG